MQKVTVNIQDILLFYHNFDESILLLFGIWNLRIIPDPIKFLGFGRINIDDPASVDATNATASRNNIW